MGTGPGAYGSPGVCWNEHLIDAVPPRCARICAGGGAMRGRRANIQTLLLFATCVALPLSGLPALAVSALNLLRRLVNEVSVKNIYVGNMSFQTDEEALRSTFSQFGAVENVNIVRDRDSGQPRGFAFVEMPNDSEAEAAMAQLNGSTLDGRQL